MGIKKAKTKEVKVVSVGELASTVQNQTPVVLLDAVKLPHKQRTTQILGGTPAEAAAALVEKLQFEVRAI
jgi:electron transfer flavoprotein alpha/beta subunit